MVDYAWGANALALHPQPDIITGADILYEQQQFPALLESIQALSAPHTLTYLAYRTRGVAPVMFEGMRVYPGHPAVDRVLELP